MDWKKYGYVLSSTYRQRIILALKESPKTPKQMSLELRLHLSHISSTLKSLTNNGIVECLTSDLRKGKVYGLTKDGREIADKIELS